MTKASKAERAELEPRWLEASANGALAALTEAGAAATALVEAWIERGNAAAVVEAAEHAAGATRKTARRGLNVLKARGIALPERKHVASLVGAKAPETFEAWLLAPDTAGNVLIVLAARAPTSRYRAAFVVLHDTAGVQRIDVMELSQSGLRDTMARALPGAGYKPVGVSVEWARARVARVRRRHGENGVPEPLGLTSAASLLEPVPDEMPSHPFDEEGLVLSDEDARAMAAESQSLHELPEFRGWFPAKSAVDELLVKLGESLTPGEEPEPEVFRQKLEQEIRAATDRYFSPQRREELLAAMRDAALSVLTREGEQRALEVVAAMKVTESAGLITDPPQDVAFLRGFFEKAVTLMLAQNGGRLRVPIRARAEQPSEETKLEQQPPVT
jgi:hypothetical protein